MGEDSAIITVDDGNGGTATKTLTFDARVSTPTLADTTSQLLEDNASSGTFNVTNPIGGVLTYEIITTTVNGVFSVDADGSWNYNPGQDYNGTDAVVLKVTNEYGLSTTSTLTYDIEAVNDVPVVITEAESFVLQDVREQTGEVEASDVDGDVLSYTVTTQAAYGSVSIDESGAWTYVVEGYYMGEDSAVITVDDGNGGTATKALTFDAKVSAPTLADGTSGLLEDASNNGTFSVVNPVGGVVTYEVVTATANGVFSVDADGNWNYSPNQDYNGSDAVIVKVTNEYGLSTTSILGFEIEAVNDAPIIVNGSEAITLTNIRDIDGQLEASDVDGDTLTYGIATQAANGTVTVDSEGNWHYRAESSFNGVDSATILVEDGNGGSAFATLEFTVEGYVYEGQDLIIDDTSGDDTLVMNGIDKNTLSFKRENNDLAIAVADEATVTLKDYFINTDAGIEKLITAQGEINLSKDVITDVPLVWGTGEATGQNDQENLLYGTTSFNEIKGANLNDIIFGGGKYDFLKGLSGDDLLIGGNAGDDLYGGDGNDTLYGDSGLDNLYGGNGDDALIGGGGHDAMYGQAGNDILWGDAGHDELSGGSGDDFLSGGAGYDIIWGGDDNDIIYGNEKDDELYGNNGDDLLSGGTGYDIIKGGNGNDTVYGNEHDDKLYGNDGDDTLSGGSGDDILKGDAGNDTYLFNLGDTNATITDSAGDDTILFGEGIGKEDVSFYMKNGHLNLQYSDDDTLKVKKQNNAAKQIEKVELDDGNYLTHEDIELIIQQINAYASDNGMGNVDNQDIRNNKEMMQIVTSAWQTT